MKRYLSLVLTASLLSACATQGVSDTDSVVRSLEVERFLEDMNPQGTVQVVIDDDIETVTVPEFVQMVDDGIYDLVEAPPSPEGPCIFGIKKEENREDIVIICCISPTLYVIVKWTICQGGELKGCFQRLP